MQHVTAKCLIMFFYRTFGIWIRQLSEVTVTEFLLTIASIWHLASSLLTMLVCYIQIFSACETNNWRFSINSFTKPLFSSLVLQTFFMSDAFSLCLLARKDMSCHAYLHIYITTVQITVLLFCVVKADWQYQNANCAMMHHVSQHVTSAPSMSVFWFASLWWNTSPNGWTDMPMTANTALA